MSTKVEKRVLVNVPVSVAYNQWTQFEEFPHFMGGVKSVKQLSDDRLEWVAEIGGVRRQWQARILEQTPDRKVAWAATEGATNAGSVTFEDLGGGQTSVQLSLEYEPEGMVEKVGDKLNIVERQAESDLNRFKAFIEDEGYATGAWRGSVSEGASVGTPGVDEAAGSRGDSGKAGVSGKLIAGVGLAAAAAAGVAAAAGNKASGGDAPAQATPYREAGAVPPTGTAGSVFPGEGVHPSAVPASEQTVGRSEAKPFDQTNGLIDTEGDSDGTALSDTASGADRQARNEPGRGPVPPTGGSLGQH
ncbi:Polyketide cyclase / dehydrase and lipid transport [Arthrobacter sp. ov407]|uniref:SRPBCC family protein n=1 Tax=Arthrobacter sp. ov407 TaxID=1761748 RepID=UPI00088FC6D0|nr:SRPBCC family protein [Arthrobacter sp. ov407]SDL83499.1 Polyketide cyclase / dehydrase and lipid transport [Arthrobacter sp. ov407]